MKNFYKIPFKHEIEIIINDNHSLYNHAGRDLTYNNILKNKWFWNGILNDIQKAINSYPNCNKNKKYKKLKGKSKIIIENGPHYRYVDDLWTLPKEISNSIKYKYILDVVDHFSKWYYGYALQSKNAEEILKNIDLYCENFGYPKILQTDNGGEFKNAKLKSYCNEHEIKLIHSSPYHPQTNGAVEVTHKEIQKYIYNEYLKNTSNFDIEESLFNIIKIHNNKVHSTTKRIPKEIRDITDENEINEIKDEIIKTLKRKNKDFDIINFEKYYVLDDDNIIIKNNEILKAKS